MRRRSTYESYHCHWKGTFVRCIFFSGSQMPTQRKKGGAWAAIFRRYQTETDSSLKLVDIYLLFVTATLAVQLIYILVSGVC